MVLRRKTTIFVMAVALAAAAITTPSRANAAGMSVGPYVWYAWWMPCYEEIMRGKSSGSAIKPVKANYKMNPSFLFGPAVSINSGNWSWSTVFVLGWYEARSKNLIIFPPSSLMPQNNSNKTIKYDVDSTLNYAINKNVKVFLGLKYQRYNFKMTYMSMMQTMGWIMRYDDAYHGPGLGFGAGFTFNLVDNLYLLWNLSLTGYCSFIVHNRTGVTFFQQTSLPIMEKNKLMIGTGIGPNSTLSLAYYIVPANLTLSLGFRYQYIYFFGTRLPAGDNTLNSIKSKSDHFFGINMSVVYSFNFSKDGNNDDDDEES